MLSSIFQHYKEDGGIATVLFNVKGSDLLFLDQPAENLSATEKEMYKKLEMDIKPFENVKYFAPYKSDKVNLNTLRTNDELLHNINALSWGLNEIFDHVQVVLNKDDIDAKADAFLSFMKEKIVDVDKIDSHYCMCRKITNFNDLEEWFNRIFDEAEGNQEGGEGKSQWRGHAIATIRKVYNRLINITTRCKGLVTNDSTTHDLPWGNFEDRGVYVVDVANVIPLAQDLVFTRIVEKLRNSLN